MSTAEEVSRIMALAEQYAGHCHSMGLKGLCVEPPGYFAARADLESAITALVERADALEKAAVSMFCARSEADRVDAERWRFVRDAPATQQDDIGVRQWLFKRPGGADSMDAAIDAARQESQS